MLSKSQEFRKKAASSLRAARKAAPGDARDTHFDVAASYKALAHDEEWMSGERQRSFTRKKRQKQKA